MLLIPSLSLQAKPSDKSNTSECYFPVQNLIGEKNLPVILKDLKPVKLEGPLKAHYELFQLRFNLLYAIPSSKRNKKELQNTQEWTERVVQTLSTDQQKYLSRAIRRWIAIILRDISPHLKKEEKKIMSTQFRSLEKIFSQKAPILLSAFCLDREFADTPEDTKKQASALNHLKESQSEVENYSKNLEKELFLRLQQHPDFADHWYHYASFLFAAGRIEDTEGVLEELLKRFPQHQASLSLQKELQTVKNITDPKKRGEAIVRIMGLHLEKTSIEYEADQQRTRMPASSTK